MSLEKETMNPGNETETYGLQPKQCDNKTSESGINEIAKYNTITSDDDSSEDEEAWASTMLRQIDGIPHNASKHRPSNYDIRREISYMIRCLSIDDDGKKDKEEKEDEKGQEKEEEKEKENDEDPDTSEQKMWKRYYSLMRKQNRMFLPKTYDFKDPDFDMNEFLLDDSAHIFVPLDEAPKIHRERYNESKAKEDEFKN